MFDTKAGLETVEAAGFRFRSTAAWLQALLSTDAATARQFVEQAAETEPRTGVYAALCRGAISVRHAACGRDHRRPRRAPGRRCPPDVITQAETALLGLAGEFAPARLRRLGSRILAHVAPELADRLDKALLRRQEERAVRKRGLTWAHPSTDACSPAATSASRTPRS